MRILVTGGAGFIGSHVVEHFHKDAEVVVLDNFRTGFRENLEGLNCKLVEGSITNTEDIDRAMQGIDYVFHLAALISVPESFERPEECEHINVEGTLNVLSSAANHGVKKLIHASSAAVYGDNPVVPKVETMTPEPKSPYAITKHKGEQLAGQFQKEGKLNTCSLRFFNVSGPRQNPNSAYAAAIPIFINKALANETITIFGDGEQTRDFIYVKDIVTALVHTAKCYEMHGIYNAAYGKSITIKQLASDVISLTESKSATLHAPNRPGDVKHSRAAIDKLYAAGYTPSSSLQQGLRDTLAQIKRD